MSHTLYTDTPDTAEPWLGCPAPGQPEVVGSHCRESGPSVVRCSTSISPNPSSPHMANVVALQDFKGPLPPV